MMLLSGLILAVVLVMLVPADQRLYMTVACLAGIAAAAFFKYGHML